MPEPTFAAPAAPSTLDGENPWPGLLAFTEADKDFFRGRGDETAELARLVMRERLTVLFGLSGHGKSSLLQAGLFPALRKEKFFPVYIRFDFTLPVRGLALQVLEAIATQAATADI